MSINIGGHLSYIVANGVYMKNVISNGVTTYGLSNFGSRG